MWPCSVEWIESLSPDHIRETGLQRCLNQICVFREELGGEGEDPCRISALQRITEGKKAEAGMNSALCECPQIWGPGCIHPIA